jgi:hypothetical protein
MEWAIEHPHELSAMGAKRYRYSATGDVPSVQAHAKAVFDLYASLAPRTTASKAAEALVAADRKSPAPSVLAPIVPLPAPYRITFDTNPDDCNLACVMCEQHSVHSPHQHERRAQGLRKRRMDFDLIRQIVEEAVPKGLREIVMARANSTHSLGPFD